MDTTTKDLTLLLLYLNSWEEGDVPYRCRRSWKGYGFDDLNALAVEELIVNSHRAKSVGLTSTGEDRARELMRQFGLTPPESRQP